MLVYAIEGKDWSVLGRGGGIAGGEGGLKWSKPQTHPSPSRSEPLTKLYFISTATLPVTVCTASGSDEALGTKDGANSSNTDAGIGTSVGGGGGVMSGGGRKRYIRQETCHLPEIVRTR